MLPRILDWRYNMRSKKVLCISASNILHSQQGSTSKIICDTIAKISEAKNITCDVIDLRNYSFYAPIPAKLSMMLEKMEEITFLHWWKDNTYQSEVYPLPVGIISHGGGSDWALKSYKAMVNDTIANALDTIQCKVIPYNSEWNTGISFPVQRVLEKDDIFPIQEYDWYSIMRKLTEYTEMVLKET